MEAVFDCSALMACLAPDEKSPLEWKALLMEGDLIAPPLLPTELANALHMAFRRKRMTESEVRRAAATALLIGIDCEQPSMLKSLDDVRALAATYALTVYDAAYLELAQRRKLPLATLDDDLRKAAKKAKVRLV